MRPAIISCPLAACLNIHPSCALCCTPCSLSEHLFSGIVESVLDCMQSKHQSQNAMQESSTKYVQLELCKCAAAQHMATCASIVLLSACPKTSRWSLPLLCPQSLYGSHTCCREASTTIDSSVVDLHEPVLPPYRQSDCALNQIETPLAP